MPEVIPVPVAGDQVLRAAQVLDLAAESIARVT